MPVKDPKELFMLLLSDARHGANRASEILQEMAQAAADPDVKEALEARVFIENEIIRSLDQCFKILGEQQRPQAGRLQEIFAEDFRNQLNEIVSPAAKRLFVLAKASQLMHFRFGEYATLIAAAELSGHPGVSILLESCVADKAMLTERIRRMVEHIVDARLERAA
jgi:ferritin-like metal-binding protein YciE